MTPFSDRLRAAARHRMRAYYLAIAGGALLMLSAFLPWLYVGDQPLGGVPDVAGLWILGLGALAVTFAALSIVTRRNSRHPLLLVGLTALAILFAGHYLMARAAAQQTWAATQAAAIVHGGPTPVMPHASRAAGFYIGAAGALLITIFGLTIVVRRVAQPYAQTTADDDV
jgi:hypothetical protein